MSRASMTSLPGDADPAAESEATLDEGEEDAPDSAEGDATDGDERAGLAGRLWFLAPPYLLFLLLVYLPASQNELKAGAFAVIMVFAMGRTLLGWFQPARQGLFLHSAIGRWTLYYLITGIVFIGVGVVNDNPGVWYHALVYLVWPVVYMTLVTQIDSELIIDRLLQIVVVGSIGVSVTVIDVVLVESGRLPESLLIPIAAGTHTALNQGYTRVSTFMLATLVYALPFLVACVMTLGRESRFAPGWLIWTALLLAVLASILGSRRAGLITSMISPFVTLYLMRGLRGRKRSGGTLLYGLAGVVVAAGVAVAILSRSFGWDASAQVSHMHEGFAFGEGGEGTTERVEQTIALLRGWASSPLFGHGFGAVATGSIRDLERPWNYELQYLLLLFDTGAVGASLYCAGVVWLLWSLRKLVGTGTRLGEQAVPVTVGLVSFLIANATNPYLQAYGQLWTLFLPIAVLNYALCAGLVA